MLDSIFTSGWEVNALIFAAVYLLTQYAVYKIVFRALVGQPDSYSEEDLRHWYRKATLLSAAVFAPLFEEFMFTYVAYAHFLPYAQPGEEGIVIIMVGAFFALLHLPGDLRGIDYQITGRTIYRLLKDQLTRFFYSPAAYFIFLLTGNLWITIGLHYLFNALVCVFYFDLEDHPDLLERRDGRLLLLLLLDLGFAFYANYYFFVWYPQLGWWLLPFTLFLVLDFFIVLFRQKDP